MAKMRNADLCDIGIPFPSYVRPTDLCMMRGGGQGRRLTTPALAAGQQDAEGRDGDTGNLGDVG